MTMMNLWCFVFTSSWFLSPYYGLKCASSWRCKKKGQRYQNAQFSSLSQVQKHRKWCEILNFSAFQFQLCQSAKWWPSISKLYFIVKFALSQRKMTCMFRFLHLSILGIACTRCLQLWIASCKENIFRKLLLKFCGRSLWKLMVNKR